MVTQTDYIFHNRRLAEALHAALAGDAFYIAMENSVSGPPDCRREAMLKYYDFSLQEGRRYGAVIVTDGQTAGASIWTMPLEERVSEQMSHDKKAFLGCHMGSASLQTYERITGFMARQTHAVCPPGSWYLSIIGLAPSFQGRGLGGALVVPMLDRTDQLGVHTYLETFTPRNMPFYRRLGYEAIAAFDEPATKTPYWVMARPPSSRSFGH